MKNNMLAGGLTSWSWLVVGILVAGLSLDLRAQTVSLGAAENFAVLGASTVTNTGLTTIQGDLGVSPLLAITGFAEVDGGPGLVAGSIYSGGTLAAQAQLDARAAYVAIAAMTSDPLDNLSGMDLGGMTLTPGVYKFDTSAFLTNNLILDGAGEYFFQIGSTLITASDSSVTTVNGADASQVFWQVGSSATLGTGTDFLGTILADQSVGLNTGANIVQGRAIALVAAVTLDSNNIVVPVPEPSTGLLVGGTLVCLLMFRSRRGSRVEAGRLGSRN